MLQENGKLVLIRGTTEELPLAYVDANDDPVPNNGDQLIFCLGKADTPVLTLRTDDADATEHGSSFVWTNQGIYESFLKLTDEETDELPSGVDSWWCDREETDGDIFRVFDGKCQVLKRNGKPE